MAETTRIGWTDATFNGWIGCTRMGPGCDHCYAAVSTPARTLAISWDAGAPRRRTSAGNWRGPVRWNAQHEEFERVHGRRRRVFCASLGDVFDNQVPVQWRADLFALIDSTPNLDWLLLTKRVGNVTALLQEIGRDRLPDNVWLGATVVNQDELDRDLPKLLAAPARLRFLSIEPMLAPISLRWLPAWRGRSTCPGLSPSGSTDEYDGLRHLDWVIAGGESGPKARPMQPQWIEVLHEHCQAAGVPFFFKQWGGLRPTDGGCELHGREVKQWPVRKGVTPLALAAQTQEACL